MNIIHFDVTVHSNDIFSKAWFKNNKCHRENGPAITYLYYREEYWLNDKQYSKKEYEDRLDYIKKLKDK